MADVVPDIILIIVGCQLQGLLEAVEGHIKLLGIEAAQPKIGEQLSVMNTHLKQTPEIRNIAGC